MLVHFEVVMSHVMLSFLQEGLSKVHFTADRSQYAGALYSSEDQAKQAKKKVNIVYRRQVYACLIVSKHGLLQLVTFVVDSLLKVCTNALIKRKYLHADFNNVVKINKT